MTRVFFIIFLLISINLTSYAKYDVNENCQEAWMLLMNLEIDQAKELLNKEIQINPDNYYAYYLDQTCDAYKLLINSNDQGYEDFIDNYHVRREIMDDKDTESPYYLSCYSEMELQVCIFNIIYGSMFSGMRKGFSAYKNAYKNLDKYPDFKPSLKMDGFFNSAISNLPPFVKWAASFFGVSGDLEYGFNLLHENYESQKHIKGINAEAALFIILTAKINKTPELVYDFSNSLDSNISRTFIHSYFRANIAYRIGKNEKALATIKNTDIGKSSSAEIIYNYMLGKILLRKLDPNAGKYISKYLSNLEKKEYLKEMNYNLALNYFLSGDTAVYLELCETVRDQGMDINERDREALYDASLDYFPDLNLVKARLLLDGSYYDRFNEVISDYEVNMSTIIGHQLEYLFLKARYNVAIGNKEVATNLFKEVIEFGKNTDYYFTCESALRLGYLYEDMGDVSNAKHYYNLSVKLYQKEFYEYIEDKAVKGSKRTNL